jgi:hypothetical protein
MYTRVKRNRQIRQKIGFNDSTSKARESKISEFYSSDDKAFGIYPDFCL